MPQVCQKLAIESASFVDDAKFLEQGLEADKLVHFVLQKVVLCLQVSHLLVDYTVETIYALLNLGSEVFDRSNVLFVEVTEDNLKFSLDEWLHVCLPVGPGRKVVSSEVGGLLAVKGQRLVSGLLLIHRRLLFINLFKAVS